MSAVERRFSAMGTEWFARIDLAPSETRPDPDRALEAAQDRVDSLERRLSRFLSDSELTLLNSRLGRFTEVSPEFASVLRLAAKAYRATQGAFDPRVADALDAIGYPGARAEIPDRPRNTAARRYPPLEWRGDRVRVRQPIDLGGIGKGYAVDQFLRALDAHPGRAAWTGALVNAGGDIAVFGTPANEDGWTVGVEDPLAPDRLIAAIRVPVQRTRAAVCTSSRRRRSWLWNGRPVHHLIDPATGAPAEGDILATTALAESAAAAEVLTKWVMLRGKPGSVAWLGTPPAYLLVTEDGTLRVSPRMFSHLVWVSPNARIESTRLER